jgi:hypothetical protein
VNVQEVMKNLFPLLDVGAKKTRHQDRWEFLALDLASRYGEHDELVLSVRMSIVERKEIGSPKTPSTACMHLKIVRTSASPRSHKSALFRQL